MQILQFVNLEQLFFPVLLENSLPFIAEFSKFVLSNFDIFFELRLLDVRSQVVLVVDDVFLQLSDFLHQVFEELVFVDLIKFLGEQIHFFFDQREDQDLLVFIEEAVFIRVKHVNNLSRRVESQQVLEDILVLVDD